MSATESPEDGAPRAGEDWTGAAPAAAREQARPPPRKRRRIVISCTECHRRKQKCDRKLPCTNCVSRNKESACRYETGAPTGKQNGRLANAAKNNPHEASSTPATQPNPNAISLPATTAAAFGYSHASASTLGFLHRIESHPGDPRDGDNNNNDSTNPHPLTTQLTAPAPTATTTADPAIDTTTRDRYKTLVRQLPARCAVDKLAGLYFAEFNPHYAVLDRALFEEQLAAWYRLPFSMLATGPGPAALDCEMRAFPAVVFQVCAVGLLVLDDEAEGGDGGYEHYRSAGHGQGVEEGENWFGGLKYAGGMTFEDLAREYSDCGMEVLAVLGKRGMGLNTVVAGWMRASWLKYVGLVTESWHAVGAAIRDAQEIGLHRDSRDPKPASDDAEAVLENQWQVQRRRMMWMMLILWDLHMASVLGRPTSVDLNMAGPSLPVDAPTPRIRSKTPVVPRGEHDPPTPVTRALWAHHILRPLKEIIELEKDGPCPKDFARVDRLHNELLEIDARTPAYFRLENPDTRFDALPECHWLPLARVVLPQLLTFELMALHRPYIFTRPKSRTEALKASLDMLHAQRLHFLALEPQMYKTFSLFFGTFDAIVMMASIYILFPKEHPDLMQKALQHFHWAVKRFEAMATRNPLAKAALGVLHAICQRMTRSLGLTCQAVQKMVISEPSPAYPNGTTHNGSVGSSISVSPSTTTSYHPSPSMGSRASLSTAATSTPGGAGDGFSPSQHAQLNNGLSHHNGSSSTTLPSAASSNPTPEFTFSLDPDLFPIAPTIAAGSPFDWNPPSDFDWSSLQPIYATSDLVYHNLSRAAPGADGGGGGEMGWNFHGHHPHHHQLHPQYQQQQQQQAGGHGGSGGGGGVEVDANASANGNGNGNGNGVCLTPGAGGDVRLGAVGGVSSAPAPAEGGPMLPSSYSQFGGDFGDDSLWNLLNQYAPI
ncbi:hypothetical protein CHGG_08197 [Chaetomium globosum CBS 148.51]|uniref:Zn(2)-C6 fungal-type domain-containing protein n=1 Tax=Chaetomium globosum (strain ATCC 6205 / CBS 148.51 / DSM 1962 / NBRC 6347 / NRRL 1970) TaxID=306901 RepID=Q2GV07_CHAGB|nr:uncharacterized protein CHGG_08197 [Chaetomium globosum CBS 148.51]EAQ86944.1 hypothetical protein CHGG_08197 [Chaetomium globosum CBS 148.51]